MRRRMLYSALLGLAVLSSPVFAQSKKQVDLITELSIRSHMEFLASDALAGRGSGTRDEWLAASYIGSNLKRWGLEGAGDKGGFIQEIETARGELAAPPVVATDKLKLMHGREVLVQAIGTPHASGPLVKFAKGIAIPAGSVILVLGTDAPDAAIANTAVAVITGETEQVRSRWDATVANTRVTPQPGGSWRVVADARTYLALSQTADGTVVKLDADVRPGHTWNAVGILRGTDPVLKEEAILLSAHLDHLGTRGTGADTINNGADDDASGCVAVMALAEAMAAGKRPKRTVIFGFFGSEESGGFGSRHLADHPPVPLEKIVANLQFEMLARPDEKVPPHTLWLTGYERSNLGPELAKHGAKLVQDPHPEQNFFMRSDNIQFAYRGIVAHTVSSYNLHKEYHTPADEIRLVDFAHMTDAIRSMYAPIDWLVNGNFKPDWLPGMKPAARGGRGGGTHF